MGSSEPRARSSSLPNITRPDVEHSRRQGELRAKYLDTPELEARALKVAEEIWSLLFDQPCELPEGLEE
jgi:hypothetical protein